MSKIWKVSLGLGEVDQRTFDWLTENNYLMIHRNTSGGQVEDYRKRMNIGDVILLCRSRFIVGLVRIIGEIEEKRLPEHLAKEDDPWLLRAYEKIEWLGSVEARIINPDGSLLRKWWSPHANRTIRDVPEHELKYFEGVVLKDYFEQHNSLESLNITYDSTNQVNIPVLTPEEVKTMEESQSKNVIFYGPPGTGKTYQIQKIMREYVKTVDKETQEIKNYEVVTFHQSYSYEDFVEGLRATVDEDGMLNYQVVSGVFKRLCARSLANPSEKFALFIDEINRGNIANIFGELITLIEIDKRSSPETDGLEVRLPYSGEKFSVPSNIDIYGTMNTSDHSLTSIDIALRRRFEFIEMMPDYSLLTGTYVYGIDIAKLLNVINQRIEVLLGRDFVIGHSYFIPLKALEDKEKERRLGVVFKHQIIPLLQEYFYEDWERIQWVLNDQNKPDPADQFIQLFGKESASLASIFPTALINEASLIDRRYAINEAAFERDNAYRQILIESN